MTTETKKFDNRSHPHAYRWTLKTAICMTVLALQLRRKMVHELNAITPTFPGYVWPKHENPVIERRLREDYYKKHHLFAVPSRLVCRALQENEKTSIELRYLNLAYAFWRGVPYWKLEAKCRVRPNPYRILETLFTVISGYHGVRPIKPWPGFLTADGRIADSLATVDVWLNEKAPTAQAA